MPIHLDILWRTGRGNVLQYLCHCQWKGGEKGKAFYGDGRLESIWNAYASTAKFFVGEDYLMSKAGKQLYCVTNLIDSDKRVGVVAINMDQSYFAKLLSRSLFSQGSSAYIVDRKGTV